MQPTHKKIYSALEHVIDPEMHISIVDLGLIYDVHENDGDVTINMTLTSLGCPLFDVIERDIRTELEKLDDVRKVHIELTFQPPWNINRLSEKGKALLGI